MTKTFFRLQGHADFSMLAVFPVVFKNAGLIVEITPDPKDAQAWSVYGLDVWQCQEWLEDFPTLEEAIKYVDGFKQHCTVTEIK
jgi:hypothetical protein